MTTLYQLVDWIGGFFSVVEPSDGKSIYDFQVRLINGSVVNFNQYRGKKIMIVNTASKCGYTYQLGELQKLHEQYGTRLAILGFPSNDFLRQEPGSNNDIAAFCALNFGVSFPIFEKISVRGKNIHPLYRWLKQQSGKLPTWNFCKYLFDEHGQFKAFFGPKVRPADEKILSFLK